MIEEKSLEQLLIHTKRIIEFQRESEVLKGERFNLFSILGLEHYENRTHSAFLGELLNPNGSHLLGSLFLKLFLQKVQSELAFDLPTTSVKLEQYIGAKDLESETGGRIDIYIKDSKGNAIAIENKIRAEDQEKQLVRYSNHQGVKYEVYYLNLDGSPPSASSKGDLIEGQDYNIISYRDDIRDWLEDCLKEATDTPILRESIKQYIILIKKLTNTMNNEEEKKLIEIMLEHYEEAEFIADNFTKIRVEFAERVRLAVFSKLEIASHAKNEFKIYKGDPAHKINSQIWIKFSSDTESKIFFGIDGFSGRGQYFGGGLFAGVFTGGGEQVVFRDDCVDVTKWWADKFEIPDLNGFKTNMGDPKTIKEFNFRDDKFQQLVDHIVAHSQKYIDDNEVALKEFLNKKAM